MAILPIQVKTTGISQVDQLDKKLGSLEKQSDRATKSTNTLTSSLANLAIGTVAVVAGVKALNSAYESVIKTGLNYNKEIEQQTASIKTLLGATSANVDSLGNVLTAQEKYTLAQKEAVSTMKELEAINANTPNTLGETAKIYKSMLPSMRDVGATQEDLITLTEKLSIASGAAGIEFQSLLAGVDGLATGTVLANSDLGRFLSSIGLTNDVLKESDDVTKTLINTLSGFEVLDTIEVATSNLNVEWQSLTGTLTKDVFLAQKESIKELTSLLQALDASTISGMQQNVNSLSSSLVGGLANVAFFIQDLRSTFLDIDNGIKQSFNFISLGIDTITVEFLEMVTTMEDSINDAFKGLGLDKRINLVDKFAIAELKDGIIDTQILINETSIEWKKQEEVLKQQSIIIGQTANKFQEILTTSKELTNETKKSGGSLVSNKPQEDKEAPFPEDEFDNAFLGLTESQSTSVSAWQEYYISIGNYQEAWNIQSEENRIKWIDLTAEQFKEANDIAKTEFFDNLNAEIDPIKLNLELQGWDDASRSIADIGNGISDLRESNEDYQRDKKKYAGDTNKLAKIESNYTKDQIGAYAGLASAAGSFFKEGSDGAKAFHAIEVGLHTAKMAMMIAEMTMEATSTAQTVALAPAVIAAKMGEAGANATASVTAAGSGDPYTAPARVALMIGLMTAAMTMFGGSGGSGGGSAPKGTTIADYNSDLVENATSSGFNDANEVIVSKFDRQIELLEALNQSGTASKVSAESTLARFNSNYNEFVAESLEDLNLTGAYWVGKSAEAGAKNREKVIAQRDFFRSQGYSTTERIGMLNYSSGEGSEKAKFVSLNPEQFLQNNLKFAELLSEASSNPNKYYNNLFGGSAGISKVVGDFFEVFNESIIGLLSTFDELDSASSSLKSSYDDITGTTKFATQDLIKSFDDVSKIIGDSSLEDYLENNIKSISEVSNLINESTIELLRSEDISKLDEKIDLLKELTEATGLVFENGAEDALNYLESIETVSETMKTSRENIKEFEDSFKSSTELLKDMADSLGVGTAKNEAELQGLFNSLKLGIDGLTDSELDFLNANKEAIEELDDAMKGFSDTIQNIIDSIRGVTATSNTTSYNEALIGARGAVASGDTDLLESYIKTLSSTAKLNAKDFANQSSYVFAQSKRLTDLATLKASLEAQSVTNLNNNNSDLANSINSTFVQTNADNTNNDNVTSNNDIQMAMLERLDNVSNVLSRVSEGGESIKIRMVG